MTPVVTRSAVPSVLNMQDERVFVVYEERFQLPTPSQCWRIAEHEYIFQDKFIMRRVRIQRDKTLKKFRSELFSFLGDIFTLFYQIELTCFVAWSWRLTSCNRRGHSRNSIRWIQVYDRFYRHSGNRKGSLAAVAEINLQVFLHDAECRGKKLELLLLTWFVWCCRLDK